MKLLLWRPPWHCYRLLERSYCVISDLEVVESVLKKLWNLPEYFLKFCFCYILVVNILINCNTFVLWPLQNFFFNVLLQIYSICSYFSFKYAGNTFNFGNHNVFYKEFQEDCFHDNIILATSFTQLSSLGEKICYLISGLETAESVLKKREINNLNKKLLRSHVVISGLIFIQQTPQREGGSW